MCFIADTAFENCPECKIHMANFQEAAEYLEKLEDGKVSILCYIASLLQHWSFFCFKLVWSERVWNASLIPNLFSLVAFSCAIRIHIIQIEN